MDVASEHQRIRDAATATDGFLLAERLGVSVEAMARMHSEGVLDRLAPAVYLGAEVAQHPLAEAAAWTVRYPDAVIGLLTAAVYRDLTDAFSRGIWLYVSKGTTVPRSRSAALQVVQTAPRFIDPGNDADNDIERLLIHGTPVRITGPDRTVLDLWRFPRRVPREYALVALRRWVAAPEFAVSRFARLARRLGTWSTVEPVVQGLML